MHTPQTVKAVAAAASVLALLSGCAATSAASTEGRHAAAREASALATQDGVALGMYYGDRSIDGTDNVLGMTPAIHLTYVDWTSDWSSDPVLVRDARRGQVSLVNWEPFGADFHAIVRGDDDELIEKQARGAAGLAHPILLDFAAEMNEEEGWGGHDPALYIAAYRHLHDIFDRLAPGKVEWVWAPNNTDSDGAPPAIDYYPGSAYVDWTGIDGYNWGTSDPDFDWESFSDVFAATYDALHRLGKPIIIGETASAEQGGSKAAWIRSIVPTLKQRFPGIKALVWFDIAKERDWRIRSSAAAADAFRELASDPYIVGAAKRHG